MNFVSACVCADEQERSPGPAVWSSVARRRTDLVPTVPLGRAPGRAHSMTRLDRLPQQRPIHSASPSMHHLNRTRKIHLHLRFDASLPRHLSPAPYFSWSRVPIYPLVYNTYHILLSENSFCRFGAYFYLLTEFFGDFFKIRPCFELTFGSNIMETIQSFSFDY